MPFSTLLSSGRVMLVIKENLTLLSATAESSKVTSRFSCGIYVRGTNKSAGLFLDCFSLLTYITSARVGESTKSPAPIVSGLSVFVWEGGISMAPSCLTEVTFGTLVLLDEDSTCTSFLIFDSGDVELLEAPVVLGTLDLKSLAFIKSTTDLQLDISLVLDSGGDLGAGKTFFVASSSVEGCQPPQNVPQPQDQLQAPD